MASGSSGNNVAFENATIPASEPYYFKTKPPAIMISLSLVRFLVKMTFYFVGMIVNDTACRMNSPRQTYFDLANKAFEETMAELWENDKVHDA
eukprot:2417500-Amphidinium_carterae.1